MLDFMLGDQLAEHAFELGYAAGEIVDSLAFGIGKAAVFENAAFGTDAHDAAGNSDYGGIIGDGVDDHRSSADFDVVADDDVAEHLGSGADDDAVAEGGMALAFFAAGAAERDALIEQNVVPDFGGLADYDARTVVDEETAADGSAGMDLDSGEKAAELGDHPRDEGDAPAVEPMGKAMGQDGVEARVTEKDFNDALGRRVFPENGVDLFPDGAKHQWAGAVSVETTGGLAPGGTGASMSSFRFTRVEVL